MEVSVPTSPAAVEIAPPIETPGPEDVLAVRFQLTAGTLCLVVIGVAAGVLAGWVFGLPALTSLFPGFGPMKVNTAVALLLLGSSLWLHRSDADLENWHTLRTSLAVAAAGLAALSLLEYAAGWRLGIDQLLVHDPSDGSDGTPPGRIPFATAIGLVLVAAAVLLSGRARRNGLAQTSVAATAMLATLDMVSYFFGPDVFRGLEPYATMQLHTSVSLLLLCVGFVLARPSQGVMRAVVDPGPGGLVIRQLLPAVFFLPILMAWLSWQGARAAWYSPGFAIAGFVVLTISVLGYAVWVGGYVLKQFDTKRVAAERLRHQSEDRLRRAVGDAPVPIIIHDDAERILHMSRGWAQISGYGVDTAPTISSWISRAQPETPAESRPSLRDLISGTDTVHRGEAAIRTQAGESRVWEFSTTPLGTLGAEQRTFVTMAIDVTERKQAEADLRRMNEGLEQRIADRTAELTRANDAFKRQSEQLQEQAALLDLTRDGILVRDLYGTIIYWSAGAAEMYGYSAKEALGAVTHKLLRPIYPRALADIEKQVIDSGHWEGEVVHTTTTGTQLTVETRWTLTRTERGVPQGFLEVNRDVSARKRAQDSLRDSEMRFRAVAETANEGIVTVDDKGLILYWNPGAVRMFGWPAEQVVGQPVSLFVPERLRAEHQASLARHLAMREPHVRGKTLELIGLRRDATEFPVEVSLSSWQSTQGLAFTGILRDITDRKRAERDLEAKADELARSNQELEQFAYVASHDLQEPLRMVSNYTQLLSRRYKDRLDGDANEFIEFAVDGAKRMQALIHDLLQYARVGTRGKEFKPTPGATIVDDALANLAGAIKEAGASIEVGTLPTLVCDATQLGQVFQNLIGNAIKFKRPGETPVVRIAAARTDEAWTLSVADNGIGIDPKYFDRIFQMFQRLHGRGDYPGTGIGLALCKKIIERHGGRIRIASEPGQGTTISFTIPDAARDPRGDGRP